MTNIIFTIYTIYIIDWLNVFIKSKKECVRRIRDVIYLIFNGVGIAKEATGGSAHG